MITAGLLLAGGATLGLCLACAAVPEDLGLADGRLHPCPDSPNCVNSDAPDESIEPLAFEGAPDAAFASLLEFLRAEPRCDVVTAEPSYAHVVFRTPLLRFRDDLELRLDAEAGVIHVRSASRIGYSDLGTNRRRVESIRERWQRAD